MYKWSRRNNMDTISLPNLQKCTPKIQQITMNPQAYIMVIFVQVYVTTGSYEWCLLLKYTCWITTSSYWKTFDLTTTTTNPILLADSTNKQNLVCLATVGATLTEVKKNKKANYLKNSCIILTSSHLCVLSFFWWFEHWLQ